MQPDDIKKLSQDRKKPTAIKFSTRQGYQAGIIWKETERVFRVIFDKTDWKRPLFIYKPELLTDAWVIDDERDTTSRIRDGYYNV